MTSTETTTAKPELPPISVFLVDHRMRNAGDILDMVQDQEPDWLYDTRSSAFSDAAQSLGLLLGEEHEADDDYDEHNHDAEELVSDVAHLQQAIKRIASEINYAKAQGDDREAKAIWEAVVSEVAKLVN